MENFIYTLVSINATGLYTPEEIAAQFDPEFADCAELEFPADIARAYYERDEQKHLRDLQMRVDIPADQYNWKTWWTEIPILLDDLIPFLYAHGYHVEKDNRYEDLPSVKAVKD